MEYVLTELGKQLLRIAEIEATLANEEYENEVEECCLEIELQFLEM